VKALRADFTQAIQAEWSQVLKHLKFIDEFGAHLGLTRLYGRAAPGTRVVEATPGYSGTHYTIVAALDWQGIQAPWVLQEAMDGAAFETYVQHVLAPTLSRQDVVLIDNLSAHKSARVRDLIEARGARVVFLPPYSPDFNPIELCWSKVKAALRSAKARTFDALLPALVAAFDSISQHDIQAWFAHCGYAFS